ncbi:MAG: glycine cleavage system protein GcvH [Sphingobacteriales bacterium]|nr:MAG: glycine cleavage system protein GcvH [Sphingobacteriales bacterium]
MEIRQNLRYTHDHEWVRSDETGVYAGITDFAQGELGDIVYIDIETVGQHLVQGEPFGSVEAVKTVSELFMPVSGVILEVNEALVSQPELVNAEPYEKGWMVKILPDNTDDINGLLSAEEYAQVIG